MVPIETAGHTVRVPRREFFDIKLQLIAEAPADDGQVDDIADSDLRTGIYEGGFKTWESSIDLASLVADQTVDRDLTHLSRYTQVIEVGRVQCSAIGGGET